MFRFISPEEIRKKKEKKIKIILNLLALFFMAVFIFGSFWAVRKYKARQFERKTAAEREALDARLREDEELARKGYKKMVEGEVVEIDKEKRNIIIVYDKFSSGLIYNIHVSESAKITIFKQAISREEINKQYAEGNTAGMEYIEEPGSFDSIKSGDTARVFLEKRIDLKEEENLTAEKMEIYPNDNPEGSEYIFIEE